MLFRLSTIQDIADIMGIIKDAQIHLAHQKIDQWQDGYPTTGIIENDIAKKESYVLVNDENLIVATTMFTTSPEPTYMSLEGDWLQPVTNQYGVIHRLAIRGNQRNKGIAKSVFSHFELELAKQNITSMKVDTHRENKGMQHMLKSIGYSYCGIIILESGAERLAFEKVLF